MINFVRYHMMYRIDLLVAVVIMDSMLGSATKVLNLGLSMLTLGFNIARSMATFDVHL